MRVNAAGETEKECRACRQWKQLGDFYDSPTGRGGVLAVCKPCFLAKCAGRYRAANPAIRPTAVSLGLREDYFTVISTPLQAYLLGFLAADGNVISGPKNRIAVEVSTLDRELLELLQAELQIGLPIRSRERRGHSYDVLAFSSAVMKADLSRWGVTPRKSRTLEWPGSLPRSLAWAYLLGYFDGDGWITRDRFTPYWVLCGRREFLATVSDVIERELGIRPDRPRPHGRGVHMIRASRSRALHLDEWLHQEELGLARKRLVGDRWAITRAQERPLCLRCQRRRPRHGRYCRRCLRSAVARDLAQADAVGGSPLPVSA